MKLAKREKMLAGAFGALITLFLMQRFTVLPFIEKLQIIETEIASETRRMGRLLYVDSQSDNIMDLFEKLKPYVEIGETEEETISIVMKEVERLVKDSRVTLLNMKPDTSGEPLKEGIKTRKINLNTEGSQRNIMTFIYRLENSSFPLRVKKFDFKIKNRDTSLMEADIDITLIYFI